MMRAVAGVPLLLAVACGGDDAAPSGGAGGAGGTGGAGASAGSGGGGAAGGCGTSAPATGKRSLTVGGVERVFHLHLPSSYDSSQAWPLVFNFHGRTPSFLGEGALLQNQVSKLSQKGESSGFIVVNPQGLTNANAEQTWNGGTCCSDDDTRDDVGFVDALLAALEAELCIDAKRVYATGLSNGGYMAHRLACERAAQFAAIAPVAASNRLPSCSPTRPVPVLAFNGTEDTLVSYASALQSHEEWGARNGCAATATETFQNGDSRCEGFDGCDGGSSVVQCTVQGGGHTWPGGTSLLPLGKTTQDLVASDMLWDFFTAHPLP